MVLDSHPLVVCPTPSIDGFCRGKPSALQSPITVPKLGLGILPTAILRSVSGEMPALRAIISGSRPAPRMCVRHVLFALSYKMIRLSDSRETC